MGFKDFFAKMFGKTQATPMQAPEEPVSMPQSEPAAPAQPQQPMSTPATGAPQSIDDVEKMPEPKMPDQQ